MFWGPLSIYIFLKSNILFWLIDMFSQATFKTSPCIRTTLALALSCNSNPFGALHSLLGTLYALWFSLFLQPPWWNKKCNGFLLLQNTKVKYVFWRDQQQEFNPRTQKNTWKKRMNECTQKNTWHHFAIDGLVMIYISVLHSGDMFEKHVHNISGNPGSFVLQLLDLGIRLLL